MSTNWSEAPSARNCGIASPSTATTSVSPSPACSFWVSVCFHGSQSAILVILTENGRSGSAFHSSMSWS